MDNCKLCLKRKANKKGSHVVPHFLVKSMVNAGGNGRDKEVSFRLDSSFSDVYFGRSVPAEAVEEVLGREMTEEEVETNENHYVEDYFLCEQCEKRFSVLETYYAEKSRSFVVDGRLKTNKVHSRVALLFWYSILWRVFVTKVLNIKPKVKDVQTVRFMLDSCLGETVEEW